MTWYTGAGDRGKTKVPSVGEVWKDDEILEALGDLDELNSSLGLAWSLYPEIRERVMRVQDRIFTLSARIAGFSPPFTSEAVRELEDMIQEISSQIPPLNNFIYPGGHPASAAVQVARTVCRRAERHLTPLLRRGLLGEEESRFMNRLSSYLFVLALWINMKTGTPDPVWKKER